MKVFSPVPKGSGATVLHAELARSISGYQLHQLPSRIGYFPPLYKLIRAPARTQLIHGVLELGCFLRRGALPLVLTAHNYVCDAGIRPYVSRAQYAHYRSDMRWAAARSAALADVVVAVSEYVARMMRSDLGSNGPVRTIYNGIDAGRFHPVSDRPHNGRAFRVLFSGNLSARKRAHLLPPLARALGSDFEIYYTLGCAETVRTKGLFDEPNLHSVGKVDYEQMPELYRRMDALFMPSAREGFGLSVAEAMASALPVVAADASALPELVEPGHGGFLCPIDDVAAYADALRTLAEAPALARDMGQFNRTRVLENFTLERMVREYSLLFEEVLDARHSLR